MSVFSKLSKIERAKVLSGAEFTANKLPAGRPSGDGQSVFADLKEGNSIEFKLVHAVKSPFSASSIWVRVIK